VSHPLRRVIRMDLFDSTLDGLFDVVPRWRSAFVRGLAVVATILFWLGDRATAIGLMTWLLNWTTSDLRMTAKLLLAQLSGLAHLPVHPVPATFEVSP
jgi:hypothetical protein